MVSEAPPFWWQPADWRAWTLWPISKIYGSVAAWRMRNAKREGVDAPVLCIGNFTVGGTGKTPTAIAFAAAARAKGLTPGFLTRGHGGKLAKPHLVDVHNDSAKHVGDEPLLLAMHAPVAVTANRAAGAALLIDKGCDFLIMDDGFQSARIHIDYALALIDGRFGLGNGHIIPGGPVRAPIAEQLRHATALLRMVGGTAGDDVVRLVARAGKPIFEAHVRTRNGEAIDGRRFLAFAGIGHPQRFFESIVAAGGEAIVTKPFGDHHVFQKDELAELDALARQKDLHIITTEKDAARLRHADVPAGFSERLQVLEIETVIEGPDTAARIVSATVAAWKERRLAGKS